MKKTILNNFKLSAEAPDDASDDAPADEILKQFSSVVDAITKLS
jgi:hypothetical protein